MSMHRLGETRSRRALDHLLQTPDTFVWSPLPGMVNATACVHAAPALGANFTQYTASFEAGGSLGPHVGSRFVFVTEGSLHFASEGHSATLGIGGYCYLPPGLTHTITADAAARAQVIEKSYVPLDGVAAPQLLLASEGSIPGAPLNGDDALQVRALLPPDVAFDFAVNTMEYQPGASLSLVEIHVMEHGLTMLEGEGIYRLGESWYPVTKGDFIWMGPYCPQWFGALGKQPAKYLIYKDWNRHPMAVKR
ncbi:(S)-ureidoglycine aminohydrolase [Terriglobus roseus]|uniref:(S)-ureidoglycine aminohydrolase n=1 Tax=Terriglobus roseus TaxID=392734 RepID=A0A1H4KQN8_9BACT|nr:(S)-ureidoglycine aminohydrolase [Terriglobus roseus]SEB60811.1 (S)-ureidoglycine aminohydrolase [Terriglobus roseus]